MQFVYIVCKDRDEARRIGRHLVERRLAACVNYFPIESLYRWEGEMVEDSEFVLIAKTTEEAAPALQSAVEEIHSYQVPCIATLPVVRVNPSYLGWVEDEVTPDASVQP